MGAAERRAPRPGADVVTIIGDLDGLRDDPPPHAAVVEDPLVRAVAEFRDSP